MMRNLKTACLGLVLCAGCSTAVAQTSVSEQQASKPQVAQKDSGASLSFSEINATVRRKSRVPPRLPSFLHFDYAILHVSSSGYTVLWAADPDCEGQHVCSFGSVQGGVSPFKMDPEAGPGVPVILRRGIRGRFFKSMVYAYPTEAYVTWREGRFYYAIGMKAGRKKELMREVNSAIPDLR
jgi:hypothetical protein